LAPAKDKSISSPGRKKLKNKDVLNVHMSKNIQPIFGVTITIGSGKRVTILIMT